MEPKDKKRAIMKKKKLKKVECISKKNRNRNIINCYKSISCIDKIYFSFFFFFFFFFN